MRYLGLFLGLINRRRAAGSAPHSGDHLLLEDGFHLLLEDGGLLLLES